MATAWTGKPTNALPTPKTGWRTAKTDAPHVLRFAHVGDWTLIGAGREQFALFDQAVARASQGQMPVESEKQGWLDVVADLPKLAARAGWQPPVRLGEMQFTAFGRDDNVRTEGTIRFSNPLHISLPEWELPLTEINDPLTAFTALRGLDGWLTRPESLHSWGISNVPNQAALWAMDNVPFQIYWSVPFQVTTNLLAILEPALNQAIISNIPPSNAGGIRRSDLEVTLRWEGLPILTPFAAAITDQGKPFFHGGFFPRANVTNPPPPELFSAFRARTNTVYYDWEITQNRLLALRQFSQLACLILGRSQARESDPGWKWIPEVAPLLGNTVTEVTQTSPTELRFTRRSHLGLTGAEITLLVRMLDSTAFPLAPWDWLKPDPAAFSKPRPRAAETPAKGP
jgi:hypothetical protein